MVESNDELKKRIRQIFKVYPKTKREDSKRNK
ncbi:Uncharacterised protein [Staphylococcus aureus]|nr:Uncharacterised protein [Staphylococcus aureus]